MRTPLDVSVLNIYDHGLLESTPRRISSPITIADIVDFTQIARSPPNFNATGYSPLPAILLGRR